MNTSISAPDDDTRAATDGRLLLDGLRPAPGLTRPPWQFFRSIFQNAPEGIAMLDPGQRVVVWNRAAAELAGQPASEVLGRRCLLHDDRLVVDLSGGSAPTTRPPLRVGSATASQLQIQGGPAPSPRLPVTLIPLRYEGTAVLILFRSAPWRADREPGSDAGPTPPSRTPGRAGPTPSRSRRLTEREQQILGLLAAGHTAKAIATQLGVSLPTVRTHTQHILRKLGVHSALEAVVWFLRTTPGRTANGDA